MTKSLTAISADLATTTFRYYDLKNWRAQVERHLRDPILNDILVEGLQQVHHGAMERTLP